MRICHVSPAQLSTNPRLWKEASALNALGVRTTIVCGAYLRDGATTNRELAADTWKMIQVPFGPLQASKRNYVFQTARSRFAKAMVRAGMRSRAAHFAVHPVAVDLVKAAMASPADLYIAHYIAALPAAAMAARLHGAKYAFDAEDFHLGDLPDRPEHDDEKRLIRDIEAKFLPGAAFVTAASPGIADAYVAEYGMPRPTVVLNTFPKCEAPVGPTSCGSATPGPSVYWFSQTIGPNRGLECAVEAIARAKSKPHLHLRGTPAKGYKSALEDIAAQLNISNRLSFHSPDDPGEMVRLSATYDIGLSSEPGFSRNNRLALGNKLFTYILAGIPIVASNVKAHQEFLGSVEGVVALYETDNPESLASVIDAMLSNPRDLAEKRARAYELAQTRFNWEYEAPKLQKLVVDALATGSKSKIDRTVY